MLREGTHNMVNDVNISIIIPVYNAAAHLVECIDSLINQTFSKYEIIFVDDGSSDESVSIVRQYMQDYKFIRLLFQHHKGAGTARNLGIKDAGGDYLLFLDADDYFDHCLLEKVYSQAVDTSADIVLFDGRIFNTITKETKDVSHFFRYELVKEYRAFSAADVPDSLFSITNPAPWTKLFRKQFVLDNEIEFQELQNTNDMFFTMACMSVAGRISYVNERLVYYRSAQNNSTQNSSKDPVCVFHAIYRLYSFLKERNLYESLEKSFVTLALSLISYTIRSSSTHSYSVILYSEMRSDQFGELRLFDHEIDFYTDQKSLSVVKSFIPAMRFKDAIDNIGQDHKCQVIKKRSENPVPVVSVIIPCFNSAEYLKECISSVLSQSYNSIEIVCINDGSTDNSLDILLELASKDDRITVLSQENAGLSAARNTGVRNSSGTYILFLDSDDCLRSDCIEKLTEELNKGNHEILFFNADVFTEEQVEDNADLFKDYVQYYTRRGHYSGICTGPQLLKKLCYYNEYLSSACFQITLRDFFLRNDLWFSEGYIHEDIYYTFNSLLCAARVGLIEEQFYHRRIRNNSIVTSDTRFENSYGYYIAYWQMCDALKKHKDLNAGEIEAAESVLKEAMYAARNRYVSLPEEEKRAKNILPDVDRIQFESFVEEPSRYRKQVKYFMKQSDKNLKQADYYKNETDKLKEAYISTKRSYSFKIGRAFTWLPRRIRAVIRSIKGLFRANNE